MTEHEAYVAFNMAPDIGYVRLCALAKKHGGVVAAWEAFREKVDRHGEPIEWERELCRAERMHVTIVTCDDSRYPASLGSLPSKPLALYVFGDPNALAKKGIAIVGTRSPTLYGLDMAEKFSYGVARSGYGVISGLAVGVDAAAHKAALSAGGTTVGVLGGALDRFFPEDNRDLGRRIALEGGAVVSEYPFGFPPGKQTFPQRNRIVAALSRGVLAVEAPLQSGSLITCAFASKIGRKVMAIPANIDSRNSAGCWKLIREGAAMVISPEEAVAAVEADARPVVGEGAGNRKVANVGAARSASNRTEPVPKEEPSKKPQMTLEEAAVLKAIPSVGITLDRLAFDTRLPAAIVGQATMSLRLKRLVRFLPGNRVAPEK